MHDYAELFSYLMSQSNQTLDYILESGKLNQYFLQDRFWCWHFLLRGSWDI